MSNLDFDSLDPETRAHYKHILKGPDMKHPQHAKKSPPRKRTIPVAILAFVVGALLFSTVAVFAASLSSGTFSMNPSTSLGVACPNTLSNSSVATKSETVNCAPNATTTTTVAPTTTTTVAPTTTTTAAGGSCPGGTTTGEDYSHGGTLGPYSDSNITASNGYNTYVAANGFWQPGGNDSNTLCVTNASQWTDTVNFGPAGNGAVQGYPDTKQDFGTDPTTLTSTFNATSPPDANGNWESAYDLWGSWGDSDIMVWENTSTARGAESSYGGAIVQNTNAVIGGVSYTLIYYCGSTPNCTASSDTEHMLVRNNNVSSGTENLQADVDYLQSIGDIPSTSVSEADFGWEICSTGTATVQQAQKFTLNSYTLTSS